MVAFRDVPNELRESMLHPAREYIQIATGFGHGEFKFEFHKQLCDEIFDYLFPSNAEYLSDYRSLDIHDEMLDVVDFLDEAIGLPIRKLTNREINLYANKLITRLWADFDKYRTAVLREQKERES